MTEKERAEIIIADLRKIADRTPDPRDRVTLSAASQFIRDAIQQKTP